MQAIVVNPPPPPLLKKIRGGGFPNWSRPSLQHTGRNCPKNIQERPNAERDHVESEVLQQSPQKSDSCGHQHPPFSFVKVLVRSCGKSRKSDFLEGTATFSRPMFARPRFGLIQENGKPPDLGTPTLNKEKVQLHGQSRLCL